VISVDNTAMIAWRWWRWRDAASRERECL